MNVSSWLSVLSLRAPAGSSQQTEPKVSVAQERVQEDAPINVASKDVYHGADDPATERLLAQSGVNAYTKLQNISEINEKYERSVRLLTNDLPKASAGLQGAYHSAVSKLSSALAEKDWGFSVSDGYLVFKEGHDKLSAQDRKDLQVAFGNSSVEPAAAQVADAIVSSIAVRRESGESSGHLGWGRFEVDRTNFSDIVDLRAYVSSILPGGKYNMNSMNPTDYSAVHTTLAPLAMLELIAAGAKALPSK